MHQYANPTRFIRWAHRLEPWFVGSAILALGVGLGWGLVFAPEDYQQGDTVRIMYVHVPAAWMGLFLYASLATASAAALIWRHPVAELWARAVAPVGAAFTIIALATGSLWGQPMWGTWWVWDARLTSVLLLLFLYIGYMALWQAIEDPEKAGRAASVLGVVGVVNLPVIKFSVDWWNTLHQPASVMRLDGPTIDPSMLWPLMITALGASFFGIWMTLVRTRMEVAARKLHNRQMALARGMEAQDAGQARMKTVLLDPASASVAPATVARQSES